MCIRDRDERIQSAENAAKEKLALERKVLEEEMERFAEERANLEASVSEKRAKLEHAFEEKERRFMSTCEMKVAAAKAAAASEFKAAAALQLKVKELTRTIEEVNEGKNDSDAVVTVSHMNTATASTPTPMKATTTTNTNILKSGGARRVLQPLNPLSTENEDDREDDYSFHLSKKPRTSGEEIDLSLIHISEPTRPY